MNCYKKHQETSCTATLNNNNNNATTASTTTTPSTTVPSSDSSPSTTATAAAVSSVSGSTISKADEPTVSQADLDALARDPQILAALSSTELQNLLRTIDAGGQTNNASAAATDDDRRATLEKLRKQNSDFEGFIQNVLQIINKEDK